MGVVGAAIKGFGKALKIGKKAKPKKTKLYTEYRLREGVDIKQYKRSNKHSWPKKIGVEVERESGKLLSQAASGVNIKFKKSGMPYVPKGTKPSMLTKAKGWAKIAAPGAAWGTIRGATDAKKKSKKK